MIADGSQRVANIVKDCLLLRASRKPVKNPGKSE